MRRKAVHSGTLIIVALALSSLLLLNPYPGTKAQTTTDCCGTNPPTAPREMVFPYYSLADGYNSTLMLVSSSPKPLNFIMAIHGLNGQTEISNSMSIQPGEKLAVGMGSLLTSLGADVTGTFLQGSVSVYLEGTIMPLAGQMTVENPARHWVHQVDMVENDPGRSDIPAVLSGEWWGLSGGRDATIMVTNASGNTVTADVFLAFAGKEHKLDPLVFNGNQTKLLSVAEMLGNLNASVSEAPEGRITIIQRGPNPSLVAQGRVTDPVTGFSTTLEFPDPARQHASALHASGVPIGTPTADSPFAGDGYFTPHVIASNLTDKPQPVTITLEYPEGAGWRSVEGPGGSTIPLAYVTGPFKKDAKDPNDAITHPPNPDPVTLTGRYALAPLTVGANSTVDFSLAAVVNQLPLPLPYVSVRIQYSGTPGSVIAQVSSVDENQDLVVDAHTANELDGWAGSGANPWHVDSQTDSVLFLTDEGDQPARIGLDVTASGAHYYLIRFKLAAHETRAIDFRALRDSQVPDFKGNRIPAGASDGSVNWVRLDDAPVEGRMMVIQKQQGMAESYDCASCPCPAGFSALNAMPDLFSLPPGYYDDIFDTGLFSDCNGYQFYVDVTYSATFGSSNTSVIKMDSSVHNRADALAPGSATITGSFEACTFYDTNPDFNCPCEQWRIFTASSTGNVCGLSISSPTSGQVFSMGGGNYNQATVSLEATSACTGTANWTLNFTYTSRLPATFTGSTTTSTTINQSTNYTTPVGEGGQVTAQAQATLAGQSFTKSITFYVLGAAIPYSTITSRLYSLYTTGATPHLLTGIAEVESSYHQFVQAYMMGATGDWPNGDNAASLLDAYVGLMMVPNGMTQGFDWITDTSATDQRGGAYIFNQKLSTASTCMGVEQQSYPSLPLLSGSQLEENALVFYSGNSGTGTCSQVSPHLYWVPASDGTSWVENSSSPEYTYVNNVENSIQ